MKTIVVTGGAGFIGSHLCRRLLEMGNRVISIDNFNDFYDPKIKRRNIEEIESAMNENHGKFFIHEGDIRNKNFLEDIFNFYKIDCIVHLAAYAGVRPSIDNPVLYNDVNTNGTMNMLEAARRFGIKYFVFASSSSVYGNNKKVPFSENDCVDFPISPYAATKKAGELICHTYHSLYGINVACLRFFTVYGPGQRPDLAIHKFTQLIYDGKEIPFYGDGTSERDYTYIDDIIDGTVKSIEWVQKGMNKYEIFNFGESNTISLKKMVETIEKVSGKKARIKKLPMQPGDVERTFADVSKARQILNYNPVMGFEEGVKGFIDWYRAQKNYKDYAL